MHNKLPSEAACVSCGYRLRGLSSFVCPECGQAFDPSDPRTFAEDWRLRVHRWLKPPSPLHLLAVSTITIGGVYALSFPLGLCIVDFYGGYLLLGLVLISVVAFDYAQKLLLRLRYKPLIAAADKHRVRPQRWRWAITPCCLILLSSAVCSSWPLLLRFRLSQPALEEVVLAVQAGATPVLPRRIGLYLVCDIRMYGPNDIFFALTPSPYERIGFRYVAGEDGSYLKATRLAPCWYVPWERY